MCRLFALAGCGLLLWTTSNDAAAQSIHVSPFGGVGVHLPRLGVSVDVLPFGQGTRVRAPLTAVDTGAYRYGLGGWPSASVEPRYPAYIYHDDYPASIYHDDTVVNDDTDTSGPHAALSSPAALEDDLRSAAERLRMALAQRRDDADVWLDYLKPDDILATLESGGSPQSLAGLLPNYQGVVNSQMAIGSTAGFLDTFHLLDQWIHRSGDDPAAVEALPPPAGLPTERLPVGRLPVERSRLDL